MAIETIADFLNTYRLFSDRNGMNRSIIIMHRPVAVDTDMEGNTIGIRPTGDLIEVRYTENSFYLIGISKSEACEYHAASEENPFFDLCENFRCRSIHSKKVPDLPALDWWLANLPTRHILESREVVNVLRVWPGGERELVTLGEDLPLEESTDIILDDALAILLKAEVENKPINLAGKLVE